MTAFDFFFNPSVGLGDCLSCFNTTKPIWSPSPHFQLLKKYSSIPCLEAPKGVGLNIQDLHYIELKREHIYNRVRRFSGLQPLAEPRATLDLIHYAPVKNNIAFSFDVGANVRNQKRLHPRARELYPEHRNTFQQFISKHAAEFNFIEVGVNSFNFTDTIIQTGVSLERTINTLRKCRYFIGMHSGLMHLATAIGLKCLIVVNFPEPEMFWNADLDIPLSNDNLLKWELHWLYPQHQYLHEDVAEGELQLDLPNLEKFIVSR